MTVKIEVIHMPPENTNSVLIESDGLAAIFDPWGRAQDWLNLLRERDLKLYAVYCTHGHFDHITGIPGLIETTGAPWFLHPLDSPVVEWSNQILQKLGTPPINLEKIPPCPVAPGNMEILPGITAEVLHLPGHSAGGLAFYFPAQKTLIVGDTLFQEDYGRTDLISANDNAMKKSLAVLYARNFPDDTAVIHGHGMETNIKWLYENNPFFK
ncbi:MAG: MBL fold metallo-hydrolase [Alphaproteobacteria bacterium]|nr:MBL fold metallo-hydrolase [Alphaproteobacteria bacterium]